MSRRYASCWNAFLFGIISVENYTKMGKKIGLRRGHGDPPRSATALGYDMRSPGGDNKMSPNKYAFE